MKTRAITGVIFIIVMLSSVMFGAATFFFFYMVLSILCLWEFYSLLRVSGSDPNRIIGIINAALLFVGASMVAVSGGDVSTRYIFLPMVPGIIAVFVQELFKKSEAPFTNIAYTVFGLLFIITPMAFFHAMAYANPLSTFDFHVPLAFMLMLWSNDTGAYLVGRAIGRTKLFERHSPKKTVEGFFGGVLIAAGAALIIGHYFTELKPMQWVGMALLIGFFGTTGDLIESMFKRSINVKDSGGILPGHGGLLDRFDGLFLAAPVVYTYLYFISNY